MANASSGPPSGSGGPMLGVEPTQVAVAHAPPLEVGLATDPGKMPEKQVNEDAALARVTRFGHLAVVCDGMGGHVGGREASHLAVETIFRVLDATPAGAPGEVLAAAVREANAAVHARGNAGVELKGMGSTCVAVLTHAGGSEVAHVGDSRVYLLTQQQVFQVTKDHSLVQRLVDANMLTPDEAANHPSANQITNALGMKPDVEVELRPQPLPITPGDVFVLCSDGLSDEIGPQDILTILAPHPPAAMAAQQMVDLANARGGHDNITVVVVRFQGGAPFAAPMAGSHSPTPTGVPITTAEMAIPAGFAGAQPPGAAIATTAPVPIGAPSPGPALAAPPVFAPQLAPQLAPTAAPIAPIAPVVGAPPPRFSPPPAFDGAPISAPQPPARRGNGLVIALVLVVLLLAIGGGVVFTLLRTHPTAPPATLPTASESDESAATAPTKKTPVKSIVKPTPDDGVPPTPTVKKPGVAPSKPPPVEVVPSHPKPSHDANPTVVPPPEPTTKTSAEPTTKAL